MLKPLQMKQSMQIKKVLAMRSFMSLPSFWSCPICVHLRPLAAPTCLAKVGRRRNSDEGGSAAKNKSTSPASTRMTARKNASNYPATSQQIRTNPPKSNLKKHAFLFRTFRVLRGESSPKNSRIERLNWSAAVSQTSRSRLEYAAAGFQHSRAPVHERSAVFQKSFVTFPRFFFCKGLE